jgi:uncharacterized SAM-binding protein YcdF (DUF218 family)
MQETAGKVTAKPSIDMFFLLAKILGVIAVPSNVVVMIGLVGAMLLPTGFARRGRRLLVASVLLTAVIGLFPLGNVMLLPLEDRFPHWDPSRGAPDGIIVLGGVINTDISAARGEISVGDAAERLLVIAQLARRYPSARIVFSGGNGELNFSGLAEADFVQQLFQSFGIPCGRILLERESRDTAENARYAKRSAEPKPGERWLLVTSAVHMPRAVGAFRMVGFAVEAYPVDWQTRGREDLWSLSGSLLGGFAAADAAAHEWVGLLVYRLTGRTSELYPGP